MNKSKAKMVYQKIWYTIWGGGGWILSMMIDPKFLFCIKFYGSLSMKSGLR